LGGSLIGELSGLPVFTDLLLQADVLRFWVHKVPLLDMFAVQIGDLDVDIAQMIVPRVTTSEDITMPLELRNLPCPEAAGLLLDSQVPGGKLMMTNIVVLLRACPMKMDIGDVTSLDVSEQALLPNFYQVYIAVRRSKRTTNDPGEVVV
jgi:hypothetical protein